MICFASKQTFAISLKFKWHIVQRSWLCIKIEVSCFYRHVWYSISPWLLHILPFSPTHVCIHIGINKLMTAMHLLDYRVFLGGREGVTVSWKTASCWHTKSCLKCMESKDNDQNISCCQLIGQKPYEKVQVVLLFCRWERERRNKFPLGLHSLLMSQELFKVSR